MPSKWENPKAELGRGGGVALLWSVLSLENARGNNPNTLGLYRLVKRGCENIFSVAGNINRLLSLGIVVTGTSSLHSQTVELRAAAPRATSPLPTVSAPSCSPLCCLTETEPVDQTCLLHPPVTITVCIPYRLCSVEHLLTVCGLGVEKAMLLFFWHRSTEGGVPWVFSGQHCSIFKTNQFIWQIVIALLCDFSWEFYSMW